MEKRLRRRREEAKLLAAVKNYCSALLGGQAKGRFAPEVKRFEAETLSQDLGAGYYWSTYGIFNNPTQGPAQEGQLIGERVRVLGISLRYVARAVLFFGGSPNRAALPRVVLVEWDDVRSPGDLPTGPDSKNQNWNKVIHYEVPASGPMPRYNAIAPYNARYMDNAHLDDPQNFASGPYLGRILVDSQNVVITAPDEDVSPGGSMCAADENNLMTGEYWVQGEALRNPVLRIGRTAYYLAHITMDEAYRNNIDTNFSVTVRWQVIIYYVDV